MTLLLSLLALAPQVMPLQGQSSSAFTGLRHKIESTVSVDYAERDGRKLAMSLFRPEGQGPHPVMIVVGGGGWRFGGRWSEFARILAREGIAAVSIQIRTSRRAPHPAQMEDVQRAIQTVRHRANEWDLDPYQIGIAGISSGGHLATLASYRDDAADPWADDPIARRSTRVRCVLTMSAPLAFEGYDPESVTETQWGLVRGYLGFPKGTHLSSLTEVQQARVRQASPEAFITPDDPPVFLLHEVGDPMVPVEQGIAFQQTLEAQGVPNAYSVLPGAGHGGYLGSIPFRRAWGKQRPPPEYWAKIRRFLKERLVLVDRGIDPLRAPA